MKKVAYFFASFLPLIITLGIQFLAVFFMIAIAALFLFPAIPAFRSHAGTTTQLFELLMDSDFNGMIMVIYSILCIVLFGLWYYHNCGGDYLPNPKKTFSSLQFAGIVVLVPGAQFFCSYMIGFLSMAFPNGRSNMNVSWRPPDWMNPSHRFFCVTPYFSDRSMRN